MGNKEPLPNGATAPNGPTNLPPYALELLRDIIVTVKFNANKIGETLGITEMNQYLIPIVIGLLAGVFSGLIAFHCGINGQIGNELLEWFLTMPWLNRSED